MTFDLNCDLGEGEPVGRTRALMRWITSANVACGGHAGDERSMNTCVRLAKEFKVHLGAHPGVSANFGRGEIQTTPAEMENLLRAQVTVLQQLARAQRVKLHHIKLHGSLYHATDRDKRLASAYIKVVALLWPEMIIYARAGGLTSQLARAAGVPVWEEVFADRRYLDDGSLVPRDQPNAIVTNVRAVLDSLRRFQRSGQITSVSGKSIPLSAQTVCIHSDTPGAARIASAARRFLMDNES